MTRFWSYDGNHHDRHETAEEARSACEAAIADALADCVDGGEWPEWVEEICWGEVREQATECDRTEHLPECRSEANGGECADDCEIWGRSVDYTASYRLEPIGPSEDLAGLRRAANIAAGCRDYLGGHHGPELEAFQHGISTVEAVLAAAIANTEAGRFDDLQSFVVEVLGGSRRAIHDVLCERAKWGDAHDDEHADGALADAAAALIHPACQVVEDYGPEWARDLRRKSADGGRRRQLVIGVALALAEIERLDRAAARGGE